MKRDLEAVALTVRHSPIGGLHGCCLADVLAGRPLEVAVNLLLVEGHGHFVSVDPEFFQR